MSDNQGISPEKLEKYFQDKTKEAKVGGYFLNPDEDFTKSVLEGVLQNEVRYGYGACPCRLAEGIKEKDLDMVCPCDYRDADVSQFGTCY